jgi:hypothetical protein
MKRVLAAAVLLVDLRLATQAEELRAGVAKIELTDPAASRVNDPCFAKALVLKSGETTVALVTVDAVAIGEIGRIGNTFLGTLRDELRKELGIPPSNVLVNASHCHGIVRSDPVGLVVQVVKQAAASLVPVRTGAGSVREDRISENRRLKIKDGSEVDMRRAYSLPRDEDVASVGPIDPQVGLLRLDRADGTPLAVLYNFACHPIMNPPARGSSADFPGFASKVIEESLGGGAMAFFIQGCAGDINPVRYKETSRPADAEPLGAMLGASVLATTRRIETAAGSVLKTTSGSISLPRAGDYETRIAAIESEQRKLLASLKPTNLNFRSFLPLLLQQRLAPAFPSHHAQSYLHDKSLGRDTIETLDADNRASVESYLGNIEIMERVTRLNVNLALLKKHLEQTKASASTTLDVEVFGLRVGDFKLVTFPGELTVQVGLNIKKTAGDPHAFVAGYTNGYIYYTPTEEQRRNTGYAQEDCDTLVAPGWQRIFESKAVEVLRSLK